MRFRFLTPTCLPPSKKIVGLLLDSGGGVLVQYGTLAYANTAVVDKSLKVTEYNFCRLLCEKATFIFSPPLKVFIFLTCG
jgi:hypothetical protein